MCDRLKTDLSSVTIIPGPQSGCKAVEYDGTFAGCNSVEVGLDVALFAVDGPIIPILPPFFVSLFSVSIGNALP